MGIPKAAGEPEKPTGKKGWKDRLLSQREHAKEGYNSRYEQRHLAQGKTVKMFDPRVGQRYSLPHVTGVYQFYSLSLSC